MSSKPCATQKLVQTCLKFILAFTCTALPNIIIVVPLPKCTSYCGQVCVKIEKTEFVGIELSVGGLLLIVEKTILFNYYVA